MTQQLVWNTQLALQKIEEMKRIDQLFIAVAFIEVTGVEWIENLVNKFKIPRNNIEIFLSKSFSVNKPSLLLERLKKIACVHIAFQKKLHAKVILATDNHKNGKLIVGSANLTWSGINSNLELTNVSDSNDNSTIKYFFEHCKSLSNEVTDEIIDKYRLLEPSLSDVGENETLVEKITSQPFTEKDPKIENQDTLKDFYFTYEDYETLFPRNAVININEIRERRKVIEKKLLDIHEHIKPFANNLDLHEHWSPMHITSTLIPSQFNHYSVSWVGLRYGKSSEQIEELNPYATREDDNLYSFPKHGCIQVALYDNSFAISFFHSVRNDSWDRAYIQNLLYKNPEYINLIIEDLKLLKGHGYKWYINNPINGELLGRFSLDDEPIENFVQFYKKDQEGYESHLTKKWKPDDKEILTMQDTISVIKKHLQLLKPLYSKMVQINN